MARSHLSDVAPLLERVNKAARSELLGSPSIVERVLDKPVTLSKRRNQQESSEFERKRECYAFVLSVDIRRSTDLMLKTAAPHSAQFGVFVRELCDRMRDAVKEHYGVFDKFTGDGILAFYPDFFTGSRKDAGYRVMATARQCHAIFEARYRDLWPFLLSVPSPATAAAHGTAAAGLGIGIDFGVVRLVNVGKDLTVVGAPVVYACRMSETQAGTTLLNYPAYNAFMQDGLNAICELVQEPTMVKHDKSSCVAYKARISKTYGPAAWALANAREDWAKGLVQEPDYEQVERNK